MTLQDLRDQSILFYHDALQKLGSIRVTANTDLSPIWMAAVICLTIILANLYFYNLDKRLTRDAGRTGMTKRERNRYIRERMADHIEDMIEDMIFKNELTELEAKREYRRFAWCYPDLKPRKRNETKEAKLIPKIKNEFDAMIKSMYKA